MRYRIIALSILIMLTAACTATKKPPVNVKCPACGYEFDVPQH